MTKKIKEASTTGAVKGLMGLGLGKKKKMQKRWYMPEGKQALVEEIHNFVATLKEAEKSEDKSEKQKEKEENETPSTYKVSFSLKDGKDHEMEVTATSAHDARVKIILALKNKKVDYTGIKFPKIKKLNTSPEKKFSVPDLAPLELKSKAGQENGEQKQKEKIEKQNSAEKLAAKHKELAARIMPKKAEVVDKVHNLDPKIIHSLKEKLRNDPDVYDVEVIYNDKPYTFYDVEAENLNKAKIKAVKTLRRSLNTQLKKKNPEATFAFDPKDIKFGKTKTRPAPNSMRGKLANILKIDPRDFDAIEKVVRHVISQDLEKSNPSLQDKLNKFIEKEFGKLGPGIAHKKAEGTLTNLRNLTFDSIPDSDFKKKVQNIIIDTTGESPNKRWNKWNELPKNAQKEISSWVFQNKDKIVFTRARDPERDKPKGEMRAKQSGKAINPLRQTRHSLDISDKAIKDLDELEDEYMRQHMKPGQAPSDTEGKLERSSGKGLGFKPGSVKGALKNAYKKVAGGIVGQDMSDTDLDNPESVVEKTGSHFPRLIKSLSDRFNVDLLDVLDRVGTFRHPQAKESKLDNIRKVFWDVINGKIDRKNFDENELKALEEFVLRSDPSYHARLPNPAKGEHFTEFEYGLQPSLKNFFDIKDMGKKKDVIKRYLRDVAIPGKSLDQLHFMWPPSEIEGTEPRKLTPFELETIDEFLQDFDSQDEFSDLSAFFKQMFTGQSSKPKRKEIGDRGSMTGINPKELDKIEKHEKELEDFAKTKKGKKHERLLPADQWAKETEKFFSPEEVERFSKPSRIFNADQEEEFFEPGSKQAIEKRMEKGSNPKLAAKEEDRRARRIAKLKQSKMKFPLREKPPMTPEEEEAMLKKHMGEALSLTEMLFAEPNSEEEVGVPKEKQFSHAPLANKKNFAPKEK